MGSRESAQFKLSKPFPGRYLIDTFTLSPAETRISRTEPVRAFVVAVYMHTGITRIAAGDDVRAVVSGGDAGKGDCPALIVATVASASSPADHS
jgi:hypothetical protein